MNKIKAAVLFLITVLFANAVIAQTIEDGKKFFYYEKYVSAKNVFDKLVTANPNNTDAAYWLGQVLVHREDKDIAGAKELYRKTLEANSNSALLTAGMGHVELLEGKTQDARNRFETAISLSQGKSIPVLNAIGIANGDFESKNGDAAYAIEKLKLATTIKGFKDPETYCMLGDAYRKFADGGGNAVTAYQSALAINPNYARANFRMGKVYQTQGPAQEEIYMKFYNNAIASDPNYIPVYYNLYDLLYKTNVVKSAEYLEKYLTLMGDDEPNACYYRSTIKYAQGLFIEAISQSDGCIAAGGANPDVRLYGLKGYAFDKLNDSVKAKSAFEQYFKAQKLEKIGPTDYETYAKILLKFPGNEALAGTYMDKAVEADSTETGKIRLLKSVASGFETQKKYLDAANWYKKILNVKKVPSKTDIYYSAYNFLPWGSYEASLVDWNTYTTQYPNETFGFYMTALAQGKIDTTMALGLALPSYQKVIDIGEAQWATDSVKVKGHLLSAYKYFIQYTYNVKKDKKAASEYCAKYLLKEPADEEVIGFKKIFDSPTPAGRPATKPGTGTKPPAAGTKAAAAKKSKI